MPRVNLEKFKQFIVSQFFEQPSNPEEHVQDVLIEIGDNVFLKTETLNILKAVNPSINPLKVKKIISVDSDQKLTIDSGISSNMFILNQQLTEDRRNLLKKDQLLFVEDDNDNTKIKVYKISFNESEDGNCAELVQLKDIPLQVFNDLFINSGLFRNENIFNILLQKPDNYNHTPAWSKSYYWGNSHGTNKASIVNELKTNLNRLDNIEDDYFIYQEAGKVVIEGIKNPNYKQELKVSLNDDFKKDDIFYVRKINGEDSWNVYKIQQTNSWTEIEYNGYWFKDLTEEEFSDLKELSISSQSGFTMSAESDNGLAACLKREQRAIDGATILHCQKRPEEILPKGLSAPLEIADDNPATIRAVLESKSQEGLYSLVIDDGKIKITNLKSDTESLFFEQPLSPENKADWLKLDNNAKYQKVYFVKNINTNLVEKWVVNDEQNQLQCVDTISLAEFRKDFANNNLFYVPESINTEGIHLGENGAETTARTNQHNTPIPQSVAQPPVAIYNVINLKWDSNVQMWNLNVTTRENTLDTKLELEKEDSLILQTLITRNNNANTVILFNKYDGSFLRAYYYDENNKKINCSNLLTLEEKNRLSDINKAAKKRIEKPILVEPTYYEKNKTETFVVLSFINKKWNVLCNEKYEKDKQVKAELQLTDEENSALSQLVKHAIDIKIILDSSANFTEVEYRSSSNKNEFCSIKSKDLSSNIDAHIAAQKLIKKVLAAIADKESLKPENSDVQWKPWSATTAAVINNTTSPLADSSSSQNHL